MDELIIAANALCYVAIVFLVVISIKALLGAFDTKSSGSAADNIYTVQAAEANQKAAEANLRAEELRRQNPPKLSS